jgi:hypothetical protein
LIIDNNFLFGFRLFSCSVHSVGPLALLSDLAFNDCPKAAIIVGDFSKGLRATCAAKAALDLSLTKIANEPLVCPLERDKELLEAVEVIVYKTSNKP